MEKYPDLREDIKFVNELMRLVKELPCQSRSDILFKMALLSEIAGFSGHKLPYHIDQGCQAFVAFNRDRMVKMEREWQAKHFNDPLDLNSNP